jgi:tetratricopeptide (TPR) repeat protein/transcriptional regulator with XRE-family HTH domain
MSMAERPGDVASTADVGFGGLLRAYRERGLLSQERLAERSGLSARTIRDLESGRVRRPRGASVRLLADALGLAGRERDQFEEAARARHEDLEVDAARDGDSRPSFAPSFPRQLPAATVYFTGRHAELALLHAYAAKAGRGRVEGTILVVTGPAGVGKTALAVRFAHDVTEQFCDGQLYADLRGFDPHHRPLASAEVLGRFLRGLGVDPERIPVGVEEQAALYRSLLADRAVLVVLDNAVSAAQVRPLLPGGPGCLVVITSRNRLDGLVAREGACPVPVGPLEPGEAVALLAGILGERRVAAGADAIAELAWLCGYLPLALRIAAARLAVEPHRRIEEEVARLSRGDRLAALALPGQERDTVEAAFDLSYRTLDPELRQLFRQLGLVPGPDVSVEAAAAVACRPVQQTGQLLEELAARSLVEQCPSGRHRMHDLLRCYAANHASADHDDRDRDRGVRSLASFYLHTANAAADILYPGFLRLPGPHGDPTAIVVSFADEAAAAGWLEEERANLVALVEHAAEHGPGAVAWRLADVLRGFFWLRKHHADWRATVRQGLRAAQREGDDRAQAAMHTSLGTAHWGTAEYGQAVEHFNQALALCRRSRWQEGEGSALANLGGVHQYLGNLQQALDAYAKALASARVVGSQRGQASTLGSLAGVHAELGELRVAADSSRQALARFERLGSRYGQARQLSNLGHIYQQLGQLGQAEGCLRRALLGDRETGYRNGEADSLDKLARALRDGGRHQEALDHACQALAITRDIADRATEADALSTLATIHMSLGDLEAAAGSGRRALGIARHLGYLRGETEALIGLATVDRRLERYDDALANGERAVALACRARYRLLEGHALTVLGEIHLGMGELRQALDRCQQAILIHRQTGYRIGEARTLRVAGSARAAAGDPAGAGAHWQHALQILEEIGTREAEEVRGLLAK